MLSESVTPSRPTLAKHKCPDCDYTASYPSQLITHRRVHSGEKPFACPSCESTFTRNASQDAHVRGVHLKADQVTCSWSGCDKTFACLESMQNHLASVHLKTGFACPVAGCKFTSGWKDHIKPHVRAVHEKEKPFACSIAGCSFRSAYHYPLVHHRQSVHEGRRLACSHGDCNFRTSWPQELKMHVESVHQKIVRFACHVCGKGFYRRGQMRNHQQMHARQGHPVAECTSCQESLVKGCKRSSLFSPEEQPSTSSSGVSDLLTSVHLDMHLLSLHD